jgi:hypothetical protein
LVLQTASHGSHAAGSQGCTAAACSHGLTGSHGTQSPMTTEPAKQSNEASKDGNRIFFDILFLLLGVRIFGGVFLDNLKRDTEITRELLLKYGCQKFGQP